MKKVQWKQGAGVFLLGVVIMMLAVMFMMLLMEVGNIRFCQLVADTRADMIADSTAVYAQSYDYEYNKGQAEIMAEMLTEKNNEVNDAFHIQTTLDFPEGDLLTITCVCKTDPFYPHIMGVDEVVCQAIATVKSVDVHGDVLYVPSMDN